MDQPHTSQMRLYTAQNQRLYLNASELERFLAAADTRPAPQRLLAYTLAHTGCRISEALALHHGTIQLERRVLAIRTLKRRDTLHIREVPIPPALADAFAELTGTEDDLIWSEHNRLIPRITAYRWIKAIMINASITGPRACPKGLRHAYGVRAVLAQIPLHMLQRWMGHASMKTTAIYATVLGPEQLALADRMWGLETTKDFALGVSKDQVNLL